VNSVWSPFRIGLIGDLEKVQKRATKFVTKCKSMSYVERLKFLKLPTLKYRRLRGDMIETFKILNGYYDNNVTPELIRNFDVRTRGNSLKLKHVYSRLDLKKYSFCARVVNAWNSLPDVVVRSTSINSFKNSVDRFWCNEEIYYNWEANLSGVL